MGTGKHRLAMVERPVVWLLVIAMCSGAATAQVIERVSVSSGGQQGDDDSVRPAISANGAAVVFLSDATNLVPDDTNGWKDVFVFDRQTRQTERVSLSSSGEQGNSHSGDDPLRWPGIRPAISDDGRLVAFASRASNLVVGDTNSKRDVFLRDLATRQTMRVSRNTDGTQCTVDSRDPVISGDGDTVAFAAGWDGATDVFLCHWPDGNTRAIASHHSLDCYYYYDRPSVDRHGGVVAYVENWYCSDGEVGSLIKCWEAEATSERLTYYATLNSHPALSADARFMVYTHACCEAPFGVQLLNRQTGHIRLVSEGDAWSPAISGNGRYIVFSSTESSIVPGDTNGVSDIFVHDRVSHRNLRVSVREDGTEANAASLDPVISADGATIAFASAATNLVARDTNGENDVFVARNPHLPSPPRLFWLGTRGYRQDGVDPNSGVAGSTIFRFKVKVTDANGDEPDFVRLVLRRDGELWATVKMSPGPGEISDGRIYSAARRLPVGNYAYRFRARDADGEAAGAPTEARNGPLMDSPPYLHWAVLRGYGPNDGVRPDSGRPNSTRFRFKVMYRDNEGDMPRYVRLTLWRDNALYRTVPMQTSETTPDPANSILYKVAQTLPRGTYSYQFKAADGDGKAVGPASVVLSGLQVGSASASLTLTSLTAVPTNAGIQITFGLSSAAHVEARILNIAGRPVKTLCHARHCEAGTNTLLWNAMNDQGLAVPNGTYLVEVAAKTGDSSQARALGQVRVAR
jgi:Tol biopolymer transport system component